MLRFLITIGIVFFLGGCVQKMQVVDFKTGTSLDAQFDKGSRQVTVVMPNNEVLTGKYSAVSNATFSFGHAYGRATAYSGAYSSAAYGSSSYRSITSGGVSNAYALLRSNRSKLMMEMVVQYSDFNGHGYGEARTNDGRRYKVQF